MRLIDADLLKEHISSYAGMFTDEGFMVRLEAVLCGIDFQPTAYDVEAVVRELEELKMAEYDDSDEEPCYTDVDDIYDEGVSDGKFKAYTKAIEIVRGGRNEDFSR